MGVNRGPGTILMTTDTIGGVWIYAVELARSLGGRGTQVVLAAMGEPTPSQAAAVDAIPTAVLESRPFRLEWMADPWDDVEAAGEWLLGLERVYQPEVIHLNSYVHGSLPWSAPVLIVGHSCVWSWFEGVRGQGPPPEWETYRRKVAAGIRAADAVTAPTRAMLSALRRHYGAFASVGAVYNARHIESNQRLSRENVVLTAGRLWDDAKNTRVLDVAARSIEWPVVAAGAVKHPDPNSGEARFEAVRLLGMLSPEELAGWMHRASIYALPARYEPFGLTALEAAQAGCALVLGEIPTLREVWDDAAVYVNPGDPVALADAINRLIRNPRRLKTMRARARRRAAAFTPERMVRSYLEIYAGLLAPATMVRKDRPPLPVATAPSANTERTRT